MQWCGKALTKKNYQKSQVSLKGPYLTIAMTKECRPLMFCTAYLKRYQCLWNGSYQGNLPNIMTHPTKIHIGEIEL